MSEARALKIVSFSGIDGAGKSTQIRALISYLRESGLNTTLLTFWDDVVAWPSMREFASRKAFGGDQGVGSPENPLNRRDKNVQSPFLAIVRCGFYLMDALSLRQVIAKIEKTKTDVVIFDRYLYDELANLPLDRWLSRLFARLLLKIIPIPDTAFLIDADPETARSRKPEYPLDFIRRNRDTYLALAHLHPEITVIEPMDIEGMESKLRAELGRKMVVSAPGFVDLATLP